MRKSQNNDNERTIKRKSICYASEAKVKSYLFGKATPKLKSKAHRRAQSDFFYLSVLSENHLEYTYIKT